MKKKRMRIYPDTSVLGGYFDDEFSKETIEFLELGIDGRFDVLVSDTLVAEIKDAFSDNHSRK